MCIPVPYVVAVAVCKTGKTIINPLLPISAPPGSEAPGITEERELTSETTGSPVIFNPHTALSIEKQRQKLPVFKVAHNYPIVLHG